MYKISTLGTGSSGNCYVLSDEDGNALILDVGIKAKDIKQYFDYDFTNVCGAVVTHAHKDHSLAANELEILGVDVYRPYLLEDLRGRRTIGKYAVQSFDLPHDGVSCCGFYIRHVNGFKMLYLTDFEYCKYIFQSLDVDCILIECNWESRFVDVNAANANHKIRGHASLDVCMEFVKVNATDNLKAVILCHTSWAMDVSDCIDNIKRVVPDGVYVSAAGKGIEVKIFEDKQK